MIEGNGPKWLFDLDSLIQLMNYVPVVAGTFSNDFAGKQGVSESSTSSQQDQDCIVMPIWKDASNFGDDAPRSITDAQIQDKDRLQDENDTTKKSHEDSSLKDNGTADQQVNTASPEVNTGSRDVSTAVPEVNTATPEDLVGPSNASEVIKVEDQEIELGYIPQSYAVPTTPYIRIHKDHPIDHVIGDVQSSVQTRRMTSSYSELGFLSAIYEGKTHKDLHTCLFACFLSQEEPKRVSKALSNPTWVEAMQEELLQFKLQKVWILVDLPKGHRAIGTKWVYRNKKDERGIVIRNKARLIEEEVYVCQPPGFEDPGHPNKVYKHPGRYMFAVVHVQGFRLVAYTDVICGDYYKIGSQPWRLLVFGENRSLDQNNCGYGSAEASTDDNGEVQITATIDGHSMTITEASLRRHLKLDDHDGCFFTSLELCINNSSLPLAQEDACGANLVVTLQMLLSV
ncbi:putative ribonuclease H-like domain-containing protein [Tanacetum coccineum]